MNSKDTLKLLDLIYDMGEDYLTVTQLAFFLRLCLREDDAKNKAEISEILSINNLRNTVTYLCRENAEKNKDRASDSTNKKACQWTFNTVVGALSHSL